MKKLLIFITLISLFWSCKEETDCLSFSSNTGLIVKEFTLDKCYSVMLKDYYLITDSASYAQLPKTIDANISVDLGCSDNPPRDTINFDQYALIGAKTLAKGCIVTYSRDVSYIDSPNIVQYIIDVHQCGDCGDKRYNMNWVLIQNNNSNNPIDSLIVDINYYFESN